MVDLTFEEIAGEVLEEIASDSLLYFKRALEGKGLVLTQDLLQSFRYYILRSATSVAAEIEFRTYGRYKDMRQLLYGPHMPPIDAMEYFVAKIGVGSFAYVPGYGADKRVPTVPNAVRRIAAGISFSRKNLAVKRPYSGTWYNTTKAQMINAAKKRLGWRTSEWILWQVKMQAERDE